MPRRITPLTRRLRALAVLELINVGIIGWATFGPFSADTSLTNLMAYGLVAAHLGDDTSRGRPQRHRFSARPGPADPADTAA